MISLATVGVLIEVPPWENLQYRLAAGSTWNVVMDRTPFRFRVTGELIDNGSIFGLYGSIESGPSLYLNLVCNIMLRHEPSDWKNTNKCGASFKVCPSIVRRNVAYDTAEHSDVLFYHHPEGTFVEGFPRISCFGGIRVVDGRTE